MKKLWNKIKCLLGFHAEETKVDNDAYAYVYKFVCPHCQKVLYSFEIKKPRVYRAYQEMVLGLNIFQNNLEKIRHNLNLSEKKLLANDFFTDLNKLANQ